MIQWEEYDDTLTTQNQQILPPSTTLIKKTLGMLFGKPNITPPQGFKKTTPPPPPGFTNWIDGIDNMVDGTDNLVFSKGGITWSIKKL